MLESDKSGKSEQQLLGNLLGIYFNNRDLKLLFDLLCAGSGVAPAIALICLFDEVCKLLVECLRYLDQKCFRNFGKLSSLQN